jgi:lipopolysaccharide export system permease protein
LQAIQYSNTPTAPLKIIDRFILKAYLGTLVKSFFGFLFILVLQFLSRYSDQIFGKGLDADVIIRIFAYAGVSLIVLTLPVSVLMASLLSMGSMGEFNELSALRAAGVSLYRLLRTMFFATIGISIISFMLSVYLLPVANLKLYSLLYDVKELKPTFTIQEGHFYSGIEGYVIRVEKKDNARNMLYGISIFDLTKKTGDDRVVMADSGSLVFNAEAFYMSMTLYHGVGHQSMKDNPRSPVFPYSRYYFDTLMYRFDLSSFGLQRTPEEMFATHHYMMNIGELAESIDSVVRIRKMVIDEFKGEVKNFVHLDSSQRSYKLSDDVPRQQGAVLFNFPEVRRLDILEHSLDVSRSVQERSREQAEIMDRELHSLRDYQIEYYVKFALPMACLLFLLIGAPLGAVIRKGGVGLPIVVSVVIFLVFYVTHMQGKKLAGEGVVSPMFGAWLPFIVLSPLALLLILQGSGSRLFESSVWYPQYKRLKNLLWFLNPWRWLMKIGPLRKGVDWLWRRIKKLNPFRNIRRRRRRSSDPFNSKGSGGFDGKDW